MTTTGTSKRTTKSAAERAQAALDVVSRQLDRARVRRDKAKTEYESSQADVTALERRRDYLADDPDLPPVQRADTYTEGDGHVVDA